MEAGAWAGGWARCGVSDVSGSKRMAMSRIVSIVCFVKNAGSDRETGGDGVGSRPDESGVW